jgi:hypothetical protein
MAKFLRPFGIFFERLLSVSLAILFMLVPAYMDQYTAKLAEAQAETQNTYQDLDSQAAKYNLTVEEYLDKLIADGAQTEREDPEADKGKISRFKKYTTALDRLQKGPLWARPFRLIKHYDSTINASLQFKPILPFNFVGIVYALIGMVIGIILASLLRSLFNSIFGVKKKKTVAA